VYPHHLNADQDEDPESTYHPDADPESTYNPDADPLLKSCGSGSTTLAQSVAAKLHIYLQVNSTTGNAALWIRAYGDGRIRTDFSESNNSFDMKMQ
jgi:hypothetical protein